MKKYKIIADFPGRAGFNIKEIGDILYDDGVDAIRDQRGDAMFLIDFEKYPHLFEEIKL